MDYYTDYLNLIFITKILFIFLALIHVYLNLWHKSDPNLDKNIIFWKERIEFIFIFLMSCLLIHLCFPPFNKGTIISGETKLLIYLFGIILLVTAKWENFFKGSRFIGDVQKILGK